jgi:hypothetical protein
MDEAAISLQHLEDYRLVGLAHMLLAGSKRQMHESYVEQTANKRLSPFGSKAGIRKLLPRPADTASYAESEQLVKVSSGQISEFSLAVQGHCH